LLVREQNTGAINFYIKHGFTIVSETLIEGKGKMFIMNATTQELKEKIHGGVIISR
jgi:ribosomal protein S18 acetylase RimI-like enzyme